MNECMNEWKPHWTACCLLVTVFSTVTVDTIKNSVSPWFLKDIKVKTLKHNTLKHYKIELFKKEQVGKDQEKAQSEKDSHSKNRGGKKAN